MRKSFTIILCLFAYIATTYAAVGDIITNANGLKFKVTKEETSVFEVEVTKNTSFSGVADIPATVTNDNGQVYNVVKVGNKAFNACEGLTSVTIAEGITAIGNTAFGSCKNLTSITMPNTLLSIGNNAFDACKKLTSIEVPNSVTTIGYSAFAQCSELLSITISRAVTNIGRYAFFGCNKLLYITSLNPDPTAITLGMLVFNGVPKGDGNNTCVLTVPSGSRAAYEAAEQWSEFAPKIVEIGSVGDVFTDTQSGLKFRVTSQSPYEVEVANNPNVTGAVNIPDTVVLNGNKHAVKGIGNTAFANCSELTSVMIPSTVTKIGEGAFVDCSKLANITLPSTINTIGKEAFFGCAAFTVIEIPASVKFIGELSFIGCRSLTAINVDEANTEYKSENGVLFSKNGSKIYRYPVAKSGETYSIPTSVTSIEKGTFNGCVALNKIEIPQGTTSIGAYSFDGCTALKSISVPSDVTFIGSRAFADCTSLTTFISNIADTAALTLEYYAFYNIPMGNVSNACKLYVPSGSIVQYQKAIQWNQFNPHIYSITSDISVVDDEVASITVYPSPVSDILYLSKEVRIIEIFDIHGNMVSKATNTGQINISHLPKGVYMVRANGKSEKVVKN
ncbi:MAG: leucine-rich repeat domain-containing protein [Porphyromonadaceae bacterium]|nr:leucine-rich repeat domain-containing protein [Porphyromonadaceae bacterium]